MSETPGPSTPSTSDEAEKMELIRDRIMRLYQAHLCQSKRAHPYFDPDHQCNTPECNIVLLLMSHIGQCRADTCSFPFCTSTRERVSHWKRCNEADCADCLPLNEEDWHPFTFDPAEVTPTPVNQRGTKSHSKKRSALELRRAHDALGLQCPTAERREQREPSLTAALLRRKRAGGVFDEQAQRGPSEGEVAPTPASIQLTVANIQDGTVRAANDLQRGAGSSVRGAGASACILSPFLFFQDSTIGAVGGADNRRDIPCLPAVDPSADTRHKDGHGHDHDGHGTQRWRRYVTPAVRDHLVRDIVREILPNLGHLVALDLRLQSIVAYLRKVEARSYEIARSRSHYYRLLKEDMPLMKR